MTAVTKNGPVIVPHVNACANGLPVIAEKGEAPPIVLLFFSFFSSLITSERA